MPDTSNAAGAGPASLLQSFAGTLGSSPDSDALRTREAAVAWLHEQSLLPPEVGLLNADYGALLRLREALRDVMAAHADGREHEDAAARLSKGLADGRLVLTVGPASEVAVESAARASYSHVVASFAVAVAECASTGDWLGLRLP